MPARFFEQEIRARLKNKRKLSLYLDALIKTGRPDCNKVSLQYIFCTDDFLLGMNQQFLSHDTLTDIITFDLSEDGGSMVNGEIYISIERVVENATKFGIDYNNELHRVIFHGALHLCGLKDKKAADKKAMRAAEDQALKKYFSNQ